MIPHLSPYPDWSLVPSHMRDGVLLYLSSGICTGGFLSYFLCGNHFEALIRADHRNRASFVGLVDFFLLYVDEEVYGTREKFLAHCEARKGAKS